MNTSIDQLLTQVYELEGLLLAMRRNDNDKSQNLIENIKSKSQTVASMAQAIKMPEQEQPTPPQFKQQEPEMTPPQFHQPEELKKEESPVIKPDVSPDVKPQATATAQSSSPADITEAFSINDRFLFQRELFDGDKQQFDETIDTLQRLSDIDKMKIHMTDNLGWDTSNEVVKEFIRLIELSINNK